MKGSLIPGFGWLSPLVLTVGVYVLSPATSGAADFDPRSSAWNGLSYLLRTAEEAKVDVEVRAELDFDDLDPRTVLMLVAPRIGPGDHLPSLKRYLGAGGRMVVADDFRAGFRWLQPFGIDVRNRAGPSDEHIAELRFLPRFDIRDLGSHLDFYDKRTPTKPRVVLNHPASLVVREALPSGQKGAIRGWFSDHARGWLAEVEGPARVLALADSSALINAMLRGFYGNKQLAANLMRYYCYLGEPCKIRLVANLGAVRGSFDAAKWGSGDLPGVQNRDLRARLRHTTTRLADMLRKDELSILWWALILFCLAAPVVVGSRTRPPLLPPRTQTAKRRTRLHETVAAWLAVHDADYRQPARLLAGHLAGLVHAAAPAQPHRDQAPLTVHEMPSAIDGLVASGRLSAKAARRIGDVVLALREVAGAHQGEVDRQRFTTLAAEVEWAEHVLSHTVMGLREQPTSPTFRARQADETDQTDQITPV